MSKSVFISHAVKDTKIAAALVELIEGGIGVPESDIFCSSVEGYGIPNGKNFVPFIKAQLKGPKVVVLLLTPAYYESGFCMAELGAAWIKSHQIFPILVPPLSYDDVKAVLSGTQVAMIDEALKYNELRQLLVEALPFDAKSQTRWETKRRGFLEQIKPLLADLAGPSHVPAEQVERLVARLEEAQSELDDYEAQVRALKSQLAATEAVKDASGVQAVQAQFGQDDPTAALTGLEQLTSVVMERLAVLRGKAVKTFALSDYHRKAYTIQRYSSDREDFEEAERRGFFSYDDGDAIVWDAQKMRKLQKALKEVDAYVAEHEKPLRGAADEDDIPTDPDTQDFWEYHYEL